MSMLPPTRLWGSAARQDAGRGGESAMPRILAGPRGRWIAGLVLLALGQALAGGLTAFAMREVFAAFSAPVPTIPVAALAIIAGAGLVIAGLRAGSRALAERLGQDYAAVLRRALLDHVARMPASAVASRRRGALALRFTGDLTAVRGWVGQGIARLIGAAIVLPLVLIALLVLDWRLGLAAAGPLALGLAAMVLIGARLEPIYRRLRSRRSRLAAEMGERLPHGPELRLMGRIGTERRLLEQRSDRMIRVAVQRAGAAGGLRGLPDIASGLAGVAVLATALAGGLPAATAAGTLAGIGMMTQTMRGLAGVTDRYRAWAEAKRRAEALFATPRLRRPGRAAGARLPEGPLALRLKHVSTGDLHDIDARIAPGQRIAITGANGAGKSTLLALAAGLEEPAQGRVTLAGIAPTSLSMRDRQAIHLAGPHSPILAGSLRRALTMGAARRPDDALVEETATAFGLGPVLARLGGLGGRVGEQGRTLSAGEAQRIRLARAALSGARLLLLDEPESALDTGGLELIERLVAGSDATCLIVTHDPAVAARMDEIWVLRGGAIIRMDDAAVPAPRAAPMVAPA